MVEKPTKGSLTEQEKHILDEESTSANNETRENETNYSSNSVQIAPESRKAAFIPKNLDLDKLLSDNPPDFDFEVDSFRHILSLITKIPARNKEIFEKCNYVPIHAPTLQGHIRQYDKYLAYLLKNEIFETDNHYIPGEKSIGYRFTEEFSTSNKIEFITNKRLLKHLNERSFFELSMQKKYHYLYQWFNSDLRIDFSNAKQYLKSQYEFDSKIRPKKADIRYNSNYYNIQRFDQQDFYFKVDANVGRLHTNLTNISSQIRNFIYYGEQRLVNVDIKNSQPLLSTVLLNEKFYEKNSDKSDDLKPKFNIYNISAPKISYYFTNSTYHESFTYLLPIYIMIVKGTESHNGKGFEQYKNIVEAGQLYQRFSEQIAAKTGRKIEDKKKLKEIMFTVLFSEDKFMGWKFEENKKLFKEMFPNEYELFFKIKEYDHTMLARVLQRLESKLVLDYSTKRIAKEDPNLPIFTIHDSIVCPVDAEGYISAIMKEEAKLNLDVNANIGLQYWSPDNAKIE